MDMDFHRYTDADWSGNLDTSKFTSSYVFITNRAEVSWASKFQSMVALSSIESEYIELSTAGQHLQWLHIFFEELRHPQIGATELFYDNQVAITLYQDPQFQARTKHIQQKYHDVQDDLVAKREAAVHYVPTNDMVADILTKALVLDQH